MGLPGHIAVEISTILVGDTLSRNIRNIHSIGLSGLSFNSYFYDIGKGEKSKYLKAFIEGLYSDTADLDDGVYKLCKILVGDVYKYRPIEEVEEDERDLYD